MPLPQQLKTNPTRLTNPSPMASVDNEFGNLEKALCDIFGFNVDQDVTVTPWGVDLSVASGRVLANRPVDLAALPDFAQTIHQLAPGPVGLRIAVGSPMTNELRLSLANTTVSLERNTGTEAAPTWVNVWSVDIATAIFNKFFGTIWRLGPSAILDLGTTGYNHDLAIDDTHNHYICKNGKTTGDTQSIGGITAGVIGRVIFLSTGGVSPNQLSANIKTLQLVAEDTGSVATNRFACPNNNAFYVASGGDGVTPIRGGCALIYGGTRWHIISSTAAQYNPGGGGGGGGSGGPPPHPLP